MTERNPLQVLQGDGMNTVTPLEHRTVRVAAMIEPSLAERLEALAVREGRTVSNTVRLVLRERLGDVKDR